MCIFCINPLICTCFLYCDSLYYVLYILIANLLYTCVQSSFLNHLYCQICIYFLSQSYVHVHTYKHSTRVRQEEASTGPRWVFARCDRAAKSAAMPICETTHRLSLEVLLSVTELPYPLISFYLVSSYRRSLFLILFSFILSCIIWSHLIFSSLISHRIK